MLHEFDLWDNRWRRMDLSPLRECATGGGECPCCGLRDFAFLDGRVSLDTTVLCGRNSVQVTPPLELVHQRLDLAALQRRLAPHGRFDVTPFHVRGTLSGSASTPDPDDDEPPTPLTVTVFPDGRALIHGTTDPALARSVYARLIGS